MAVRSPRALRRTIAALLVAVAVVGAGPTTSEAQQEPTLSASPTTVRDGGSIQVTATGCTDEQGSTEGLDAVAFAAHLSYPHSGNLDGLAGFRAVPTADGSWSGTIVVSTREATFGPYEDFETTLVGACLRDGTPLFEYPTITITYDGTADDLPETTVAPTTPTTAATSAPAPPPTAAPAPPPAAPIAGAAAYTG